MILKNSHWRLARGVLAGFLLWSGVSFAGVAECPEGRIVGNIRYAGLQRTKPHVVERELLNASGKPFSAESFQNEKLRLESLDLFSEVSLVCSSQGDRLDLEYRFT